MLLVHPRGTSLPLRESASLPASSTELKETK